MPSSAQRIRGLAPTIARRSTTPSAVSQTGRISVDPVGNPSVAAQWVSAACSACICPALAAIG